MNQTKTKSPRLQKRTVAVLNQSSRSFPILVLVTTSGITSTITYTFDPPLLG
jgi:hypothetical protein